MRLFKAAGDTYRSVARRELHAFPYRPKNLSQGELVLLSKNKEDCGVGERQIQFLAKVVGYRDATPAELEKHFPRVNGGEHWTTLVRLHWCQALGEAFNLNSVIRLESVRYDTVQNFATIDKSHERPIVDYLIKSNPATVLSFLDSPAPVDQDEWFAYDAEGSNPPAR